MGRPKIPRTSCTPPAVCTSKRPVVCECGLCERHCECERNAPREPLKTPVASRQNRNEVLADIHRAVVDETPLGMKTTDVVDTKGLFAAFPPPPTRASGHKEKWTEDEDNKLKDTVQRHVDKNWGAIAALVPGRTKTQCSTRWHDTLNPSIGRASGRKGKWSVAEDSQLKHALQTHADKDWVAIALLVPGRTKKQCWDRWKNSTRRVVREKYRGTLKKAPALGQDPHPLDARRIYGLIYLFHLLYHRWHF
jgi:hypothetical protein